MHGKRHLPRGAKIKRRGLVPARLLLPTVLACACTVGSGSGSGAGYWGTTGSDGSPAGSAGTVASVGETGTAGGSSGEGTTSGDTGAGESTAGGPTTSGGASTSGGGPGGGGSTSGAATTGSGDCAAAVTWDFETCPSGFTSGPANAAGVNSWACGDPTSGPGAAVSGVWATNLHDDYGDDESGYLASPPISMVGCEGMTITLSVEHWYSTEIEMDGGNIQVSTDGGANWGVVHATGHPYDVSSVYSNLDPPKGQPAFVGSDEVWRTSTVDLSAHAGKPDVRVRFVFGSDGSIDRDGWYIDTVKVTAQ